MKTHFPYPGRWHFLCLLLASLYLCSCPVSTVIRPDITDDRDYMMLSENILPAARAVNGTLAFIYEEEYNVNTLQYRIYGNDGALLYSNSDQVVSINYGRNYIKLSIPSNQAPFSSWLGNNPLLLEVTNAKQRKQYLTFNYFAQ